MLLRIGLVTASIAVFLVVLAEGTLLQRAGLVGSCRAVETPTGETGVWHACREGKLEGRPDLRREACRSLGIAEGLEYWRCPAAVSAGRKPTG